MAMTEDTLPPMWCPHCNQQITFTRIVDGACMCGQILDPDKVLYEGDAVK